MKKTIIFLCSIIILMQTQTVLSATATLSWEPAERAIGYILYKKNETTGEEKKIVTTNTSITAEETGITPGVPYSFTVAGYNAAGEAPRSNVVTYTKDAFDVVSDPIDPILLPPGPCTIILKFNQQEN